MIHVILTHDSLIRDEVVNVWQMEKIQEENRFCHVYRKWPWILVYSELSGNISLVSWIRENFIPNHIFIPYLGTSISYQHQIGDVIFPNVFFGYDASVEQIEITKENRDILAKNPIFLTRYNEQADYLVDSTGLSIGWIVVFWTPALTEETVTTNIEMVYEADVLIHEDVLLYAKEAAASESEIIIAVGVRNGKIPNGSVIWDGAQEVAKNMIRTLRMFAEDSI